MSIIHHVEFDYHGHSLIIDGYNGLQRSHYVDIATRENLYHLGIASLMVDTLPDILCGKYDVTNDTNEFTPTHTLCLYHLGFINSAYHTYNDPRCIHPLSFCNEVLETIFERVPSTIYIRRIS